MRNRVGDFKAKSAIDDAIWQSREEFADFPCERRGGASFARREKWPICGLDQRGER
jgi:hypothetical protein